MTPIRIYLSGESPYDTRRIFTEDLETELPVYLWAQKELHAVLEYLSLGGCDTDRTIREIDGARVEFRSYELPKFLAISVISNLLQRPIFTKIEEA